MMKTGPDSTISDAPVILAEKWTHPLYMQRWQGNAAWTDGEKEMNLPPTHGIWVLLRK